MRTIPLTRGLSAMVDDADYEFLSQYKWHAKPGQRRGPYAKNNTVGYMHRVILNPPPGVSVDHVDGDGLNNQRSNLRQASAAENAANKRLERRNKSGFKGVWFSKDKGKWESAVHFKGRRYHVGTFRTPEEANAAVRACREELHGEYANHG